MCSAMCSCTRTSAHMPHASMTSPTGIPVCTSMQWAVISTARGDRKVHLGDCVMVKVEGQKHTGVALVHEVRSDDGASLVACMDCWKRK